MTDTPTYHWTLASQRGFLECLAETGSVAQACASVSMSRRSAYNLRFRKDGAAFRLGWEAAILMARDCLADELLARAIDGVREESERYPETGRMVKIKADSCLHPLRSIGREKRGQGSFNDQRLTDTLADRKFCELVGKRRREPERVFGPVHRSIPSPGSSDAWRAFPCIRARSLCARTASLSALSLSLKLNSFALGVGSGAIST